MLGKTVKVTRVEDIDKQHGVSVGDIGVCVAPIIPGVMYVTSMNGKMMPLCSNQLEVVEEEKEEKKEMLKEKVKPGTAVVTEEHVYIVSEYEGKLFLLGIDGTLMSMDEYNDDLTHKSDNSKDIVAIAKNESTLVLGIPTETIWER